MASTRSSLLLLSSAYSPRTLGYTLAWYQGKYVSRMTCIAAHGRPSSNDRTVTELRIQVQHYMEGALDRNAHYYGQQSRLSYGTAPFYTPCATTALTV